MAIPFHWTATKKGKVIFEWEGDFAKLPPFAQSKILGKAVRIFTDRIGAEDMIPKQAGEVCERIKTSLLDGTYGSAGGFGEALDPVFKRVRDQIAEVAGIQKAVHKRLPDWKALEKAVGKTTLANLRKLATDAAAIKISVTI